MILLAYLENLKTSNIKNTDKGGSFSWYSTKTLIDTMHNPFEHSLIQRLSQSLTGELSLQEMNKALTNDQNYWYLTCSIFCDRTVKSLPVLILGFNRAFVNSATEIPNSLHIFWAAEIQCNKTLCTRENRISYRCCLAKQPGLCYAPVWISDFQSAEQLKQLCEQL